MIFPHLVVSNIEEYIDQPDKFIPERWLKTDLKNQRNSSCPVEHKKIHPFVSLPFGYGRRACLGRRFAEIELQILLAKVGFYNNLLTCCFTLFFFRYLENIKLNIITDL